MVARGLIIFLSSFGMMLSALAASDFYYDQLYKDGRFHITLVLGFEQFGSFSTGRDSENLKNDVKDLDSAILLCDSCGFQLSKRSLGERVYVTSFRYSGQAIPVRLRFIFVEPGTQISALRQKFIYALKNDNLIMYVGHSRDGRGFPDFAGPLSDVGKIFKNDEFRGWQGFEYGYFSASKYQILSLNSCKTFEYYRDPIRKNVWEKAPSQLALILTTQDTPFSDYPGESITLIRGLMLQLSRKVILEQLEFAAEKFHAQTDDFAKNPLFKTDGFFSSEYERVTRPKQRGLPDAWRGMPF